MSNTESRTRGVAQRALALLMALVLAVTLTPGFALAEEANTAAANSVAEQSATIEAAGNVAAPAANANENEASASASGEKQAATSASQSGTSESANASNAAGAASSSTSSSTTNQAASSSNSASPAPAADAETVSATLKISVYGTVLVSHSFSIEKGKTVEDLLNLAKGNYIDSYSHGKPYEGYTSYYVNSITIKGTEYAQSASFDPYWSSTINGSWDETGINETTIENDGFSYELNFTSYSNPDNKYDNGTGNYPTTPDVAHPDKASGNDTTSFVKSNGNTSTVTSAPTSSSNAVLSWKKNDTGFSVGNKRSEILTIGDYVYIVTGDWSSEPAKLYQLDAKTGKEIKALELFSSIDSFCRLAYTDGIIVIPLSNGRLQGVSASKMESMWVSNVISSGDMNMSTVTAGSKGMVFTGTTSDWSATSGTFFGINAITGECVWTNKNDEAGYYWAGACEVGNMLVYGDNAGWLKAVSTMTGEVVSKIKLSSAIRSTVISNNAKTKVYVATTDGILHEIAIGLDGSLSELKTANFDSNGSGTSAPTLFEGYIYVGGGTWGNKGSFSVIDAATMQVKDTVELPYYAQSAPLVAKAADGKTYAYFTCNGCETNNEGENVNGGGAWVYCLETGKATRLFDATGEAANYCTSSIVAGADGTLYWTNDSGTLFALANAASQNSNGNNSNENQSNTEPESNGGKNSSSNSNDSNSGGNHAPSASPISTAKGSAAAQAPLSSEGSDEADDDASAEDDSFGVEPTNASSARNASSDNTASEQQIPWLPITGIAVGCAGLIGVGVYLFRRRSL